MRENKHRAEVEKLLVKGLRPKQIKSLLPGVRSSDISKYRHALGIPKFNRGSPCHPDARAGTQLLKLGKNAKRNPRYTTGIEWMHGCAFEKANWDSTIPKRQAGGQL